MVLEHSRLVQPGFLAPWVIAIGVGLGMLAQIIPVDGEILGSTLLMVLIAVHAFATFQYSQKVLNATQASRLMGRAGACALFAYLTAITVFIIRSVQGL